MSGMEPILIGSALGAAMNRRNPLQGAMLGGVLGGFGGAATTAFNSAAPTGTAGLAGGGGSGMFTAGTQVANPMATGTYFASGAPAASAGNAVMNIGQTAIGTSPSLGTQLSGGLQGITQFARENPMAVGIGLQSANSLLAQQPPTVATPPGLMRGQQFQTEQPQYAMYQQPISLI